MTLHHDPSATTESQCQQYQSAVNLCQAILLYSPTNVVTLNNELSETTTTTLNNHRQPATGDFPLFGKFHYFFF